MNQSRLGRQSWPHAFANLELWAYAGGFVLACVLASEFMRFAGNFAVLWPANGVLCAGLFRMPDRQSRWAMLSVAALGNVLVNLAYGHVPAVSLGIAAINVCESYLAWRLLMYVCPTVFRFDDVGQLWRFTSIAGGAAPLLPSLGAASLFEWAYGTDWLNVFSTWFLADALGLVLVVPTAKLLRNDTGSRGFKDSPRNIVACMIMLIAVTTGVFAQSSFPLLFLLFPCLVLVAFQLGPRWSAVGTLVVSIIAFSWTSQGFGPASLIPESNIEGRIQFVQFFVTIAFLSCLPTAYVLAEQARLREQLRSAEGNMREALDRAERAASAQSEFLATMSHEVRTPLTSILGYTRLALQSPSLDSELRQNFSTIDGASRSLLAIVNDILDFSAMDAGQLRLEMSPTRLDELVAADVSLVRASAEEKGLVLILQLDDAIRELVVVTDGLRLSQIILNLLNNAVKFTDAGTVRMNVELVSRSDATVRVRICVADSGPGIPEAARLQLFQRFSQIDSGSRRRHGGSGLGLAICKSLTSSLGGAIGVDSVEGRGATFWIEVPFELSCQAVERVTKPVRQDVSPLKILVVDDVDVNCELVAAILRGRGHSVTTASGAIDAIASIHVKSYDVILMDIQMPGTDGLEATTAIRALGSWCATVPIIAMTANATRDEIERYMEGGMSAHISKPFDWSEIFAKVESRQSLPSEAA